MDNVEAPWVGNPDYGENDYISQEDYDYYWQDDDRNEAQIQSDLQELNKK